MKHASTNSLLKFTRHFEGDLFGSFQIHVAVQMYTQPNVKPNPVRGIGAKVYMYSNSGEHKDPFFIDKRKCKYTLNAIWQRSSLFALQRLIKTSSHQFEMFLGYGVKFPVRPFLDIVF